MDSERETLSELVDLRVCFERLGQDLSQAVHLLYCLLVWIATSPESTFKQQTLGLLRAKFFQLPQGFGLGKGLIDLDAQFGNKLESHGVYLRRWVYEPRERRNG